MSADTCIYAIVEITEKNMKKIKLYNEMIGKYGVPDSLKEDIISSMPFLSYQVQEGYEINNFDGYIDDRKEYDRHFVNIMLHNHPCASGDIECEGTTIDLSKLPENTKKIKVYMMA